jgi:hypothetical protein
MTKYSVAKCVEHSFPLVHLSDVDKVVGIPEVEFGEERGTMEGGKNACSSL